MLVVYKIKGGKNLKYKVGDDQAHWDLLYDRIEKAIDTDEPEVIYFGELDREAVLKAIGEPETFTTFVQIYLASANITELSETHSIIRKNKDVFNFADLLVSTEKFQLLTYETI